MATSYRSLTRNESKAISPDPPPLHPKLNPFKHAKSTLEMASFYQLLLQSAE